MKDKATAKNDVQVIMEEYIGNRKAAKVAERISAVMQEESKYTYKGEVCYIHKDEAGALVLTMESTVKSQVEAILNFYLEKDEAQECLELLIGKQSLCATTATAETTEFETIKVEGSDSKIYAKLMKHHPANNEEKQFISRLEEAVHSSVTSFEVPVCDPSINGIDYEEVKNYIMDRCAIAEISNSIFEDSAIKAIQANCGGSNRQLNNLIDKCLLICSKKQENTITAETVLLAENDLSLI